jgi:DNA-binding response OmpR family regulator
MEGYKVKEHILVVDDDELILFGLKKILTNKSFEVETAATASLAVEKIKKCPYGLCLLDIHLPDFNGLELMKIIKDICPETKVIIMTASYNDSNDDLSESIQLAIKNGACQFITKPFNLAEIPDIVERAIEDEENFHTGFRFVGNTFVEKKRKSPRAPYHESINFFMTVIDQGESKRWTMHAKSVDISDRGIGLLTNYPLKESQIISFGDDLANKMGVVVWSTMFDTNVCRAGIKFA